MFEHLWVSVVLLIVVYALGVYSAKRPKPTPRSKTPGEDESGVRPKPTSEATVPTKTAKKPSARAPKDPRYAYTPSGVVVDGQVSGDGSCGTCANFDREAGQKVMADHPIFVAAASVVPPYRMGAQHDEEGNPAEQPSVEMLKARWDDVGLCIVADVAGNRECVMATCTGCPKGAYEPARVSA